MIVVLGSMVATVLSATTVVLLAVLTSVWVRNYRQFRSPVVFGLVAFGAVLLVENLVAVYFGLRACGRSTRRTPSWLGSCSRCARSSCSRSPR